jgi:hypothetical protein
VGIFDDTPDFGINLRGSFFTVLAALRHRITQERLAFVLTKVQGADAVAHAEFGHHTTGNVGDTA